MKRHRMLYQATAALLALILTLEPVFAAMPPMEVEEPQEDYIEQVIDTAVDPLPEVQSGVEDVSEAQGPRTLEELKALDGVTLTEDGRLASVKLSLLDELSEEERGLLWSFMSANTHSNTNTPNKELKEQFGLTDDEIEQGVCLHGDMLAFTSELSDLAINIAHMTVSEGQQQELAQLIAAGYTCSQAILALAAKDTLGLSMEELKAAREAECNAVLLTAEDEDNELNEPEADVTDYLAEKTGLPKSLVERLIGSGDVTAYQLDHVMEEALEQAFPFPEPTLATAEMASLASSDEPTYYDPKEVLGKPYTYDRQGNFDVNLKDGSYSYTETDLSIPGKNGLDLVLTRQFHSDRANTTYAMGGIYPAKGNDIGQVAFTVSCKWYEANEADGGYKIVRELTDPSQYTIQTSQYDDDWAKEVFEFTLSEYDEAVNCCRTYWADLCGSAPLAIDSQNNAYYVMIVPTITCTTRIAEKYIKSFELEDTYLVDEFGLGHGWMLGISHLRLEYPTNENFDTVERQLRLTTSDGAQYYIEKRVGTVGNYIENYEGSDIEFRKCGSGEYPNAVYGLYYKDGKTEYFDDNGRNIAIIDRFGNKITLSYTFADAQEKKVSKIEITDTLNNTVVYENLNLDPSINVPFKGFHYNGKWRLSLNGQIIREYYTYTEEKTLYYEPNSDGSETPCNTYPTKLMWVSNEAGEFTRYNGSAKETRFNCFLQPALRKQLSWKKPLFSNDGYNIVVEMYQVFLPNGARNWVQMDHSQKSFGTYGYRSYIRCANVRSLNSVDTEWDTVQYIWGDFDLLDGQRGYNQDYCTVAQYKQHYWFADANGTPTGGSKTWCNNDVYYYFNFQDQLTHTTKTSYESQSLSQTQESIPASIVKYQQQKWNSETTKYSYTSEYARKPSCVTTTRYNPTGKTTVTAVESYVYDDKWNVLTYTKPNGSKETYTYDAAYNLPLTQTVQQDSSTTIKVTNTLTADKKNISVSNVTRGTTAVGKTSFTYNTAGQLTSQNDYLSSTNYVTTAYEYGGGVLPTKISVSGVKNASGTVAAGTPGLAAGTIARKQTYNDRGWITSQTDAKGKTTGYQYDAVGRITKVTYPDSTTQTYTYDVPNNTVTYTDEVGSSWLCTYGDSGKLLTVKDLTSNQVVESYTYDQLDHLIKKVTYGNSTPDQTVYYCYDTDGRIIEQGNLSATGSKMYQELYEYRDGSGTVKKTVVGDSDAPSVVTISYQDKMGNTIKTERFLGTTVYKDEFSYDYLGNQIQTTSAYSTSLGDKFSTKTTYDYEGRPLTITNVLGQKATKTYDWMGNLLTDTDPKGNVTHYTYDVLGRLIRVVAPLDSGRTSQTDYTYDANGNIIEERTRTGSAATSTTARVTAYAYDDMGRVIQVKGNGKEDGKSGTDQLQYTQYVYDKLGNITKMYTGLHAPLSISSDGSVTSTGDSAYSVTRYDYDRYSRLVKQTDPMGKSETYTYDLNGNLTKKTDRRGVTISNTFDAMGRLINSRAGADSLSFSYTQTGQRATASSNGKTNTYTYDSLGRLISEETPYATKTFTYNAGDLRTGFKVEAGATTHLNNTYTYDKIGRLTKVNGSNAQASYSYDANGNLSTTTYNNNTSATYTYNSANLPTQVQNKRSTTLLSRYSYTYGLDANQLTKSDNLGRTTTYTYDGLNRLTKEAQTGSGAFTNTYTYDDYSNRSGATLAGAAESYTYDANNRLLSSAQGSNTTTYTYDNQGNLTRSALTNSGYEQAALSYTYDNFNRLTKVRDNYDITEYTYDADGHRISKTRNDVSEEYVWDGDQLVVILGTKKVAQFTLPTSKGATVQMPALVAGQNYAVTVKGVTYFATAQQVRGESQASVDVPSTIGWKDDETPEIPPVTEKTRILLDFGAVAMEMNVDDPLDEKGLASVYVLGPASTSIALYDGDPALMTTSYVRGLSLVAAVQDGVRTYYHYNAHGDVTQLTNSSGTVTKNYTYDAFGVEKNAADGDLNPFRYCGEQYDDETGNYYLRARYYTPGVGRFTQEDTHWNPGNMIYGDEPLRLHAYTYKPQATAIAQSGNLYFYAMNNPIAYQDSGGCSATATWMQVAQSLPYWDGPYPYADFIYAAGSGIATLIDFAQSIDVSTYYPESETTSISRGGSGFSKSEHKGGGFSEEARSKEKGASQSATGGAAAPSGGPRRDDDDKDHMIGENGTRFTSKTTGKSGGAHIDVENPNPGKRPGDIHYQTSKGVKWRYDIKTGTFINPQTKQMAPPEIQRVLNAPWVVDAIKKALKYLGE